MKEIINMYTHSANINIVIIVMMTVLLAMTIDLIAGITKAKARKELIQSEILKRTLIKFITYEGGLFIASMMDILLQLSNVFKFKSFDIFATIPLVCISVGVFLLFVEFCSVKEKADDKTRKQQQRALKELIKLLKSDDMKTLTKQITKE